jgi:hypothetical protein
MAIFMIRHTKKTYIPTARTARYADMGASTRDTSDGEGSCQNAQAEGCLFDDELSALRLSKWVKKIKIIPKPPAQTTRPSGNPAAAKYERAWRRLRRAACGVHTPVVRSSSRTDEVPIILCPYPPSKSTCPKVLSLAFTAIAAAP